MQQFLYTAPYELAQATKGAAGFDLRATTSGTIIPGARLLVTTGVRVSMDTGYEAQVRSRSGLALKHGVAVLNAPGTIDSDYRGEIGVILINLGNGDFSFNEGDRIAQLVFAKVEAVSTDYDIQRLFVGDWQELTDFEESARSSSGFGSTGLK